MAHDRHIAIKVVDYFLPVRALGRSSCWATPDRGHLHRAWPTPTYRLIDDDIGQVTAAAEIPLAVIYTVVAWSASRSTALRAVVAIARAGSPGDPDRREEARVSLVLLLVRDPRSCSSCACPMAFAILGPCLVYLVMEGYSLGLAVRLVVDGIDSWPLLAVPLFILVGIMATRTEIADRLYDAALMLLGPLRAGLAYVNIGVSLGFSWMSGAALADAAGIGSIEVDHMRKKGYPAEFSVGLSASSALISPIMPPSIPAVVYASVAAVSTGALFAAAVIPAFLMTLALAVTV